jgi:ketosteroid isomerase-like protein
MASIAYDKALALDSKNAAAQTKLALIKDMMDAKPARKPAAVKPVVAVAPKPAVKPAPEPKPAAPDTPASASIEDAVANWAQAWSKRDVDAYLAAYASDFAASGMTRANWEAQRRARITAPTSIDVKISDLKIEQQGDTASATFRQAYRSDRLTSTVTKTLKLALQNGQWRIVDETSR